MAARSLTLIESLGTGEKKDEREQSMSFIFVRNRVSVYSKFDWVTRARCRHNFGRNQRRMAINQKGDCVLIKRDCLCTDFRE